MVILPHDFFSNGSGTAYAAGGSYTANAGTTLYAQWKDCNAPVLGTGMTPVNWNGSAWVETTVANWDYNYSAAAAWNNTVAGNGTAKWANAVVDLDGNGTKESYFVWIPRFTYKFISGYHTYGSNSWTADYQPGNGKIAIKFSNGTTDDTSDGYELHPAFTFGSDQLQGFWVAKFETSRNDATASTSGSGTYPTSRAGVFSWDNHPGNAYTISYNANRTLDSHLIKNIEWGAVAYLTNARGRIPYINITKITGSSGESQNASDYSGTPYAWNTANGVRASTTHNVYGVYDMSGGHNEFTASYCHTPGNTYAPDSSMTAIYNDRETKYVDLYVDQYGTGVTLTTPGAALYECGGPNSGAGSVYGGWDGDEQGWFYMKYAVRRGGFYTGSSGAGIFYAAYGKSNTGYDSSRMTLAPR